ncbi:topoisomerase C-terminal repeat-containing protein [Rubrobacter marinus]|uniref:topoisomerase C-terminal repeat-containing protein n=1 Tax=Rubrobacter marinus TaxID=2653852 RepID=UPI002B1BD651|nr:topoisomerase C-terminal repeat-containing protein [Rubrobacter marinus]
MERGAEPRPAFMQDIKGLAASLVEEVRGKEGEKVAAPARRGGGRRGPGRNGSVASDEPLGTCPKCGSPVVESRKAYGCSAWKTGCSFAIWKTVSGKRISVAQAKQLLQKGRTEKLKGFKSKAGRPYSAALALDGDHKVKLDFEGAGSD